MRPKILAAALVALVALPAGADEVTDAIENALKAYRDDGDVQYALEELAFAQQLLQEMKTMSLVAFLPEAPKGWTRTVDTDMAAGLAMMGGGTGAEAEYTNGADTFTITILADSPMVAAMAGIMGNAAAMAAMGKMVRVGRQKYLDQDGELSTLVNNRVLVQAEGAPVDTMVPVLETIDYRKLGDFGQ